MRSLKFLTTSALGSAAFLSGLVIAGTASAQDQSPVATPDQQPAAGTSTPANEDEADVVVTGSRISAPNLVSVSPITSVTGAQLQQTGSVSIGDVLNNLPQVANTFSQSNSTRFLGTAGLNLVDLYGLGPQRTLVLVNGRRHVGADILNNAVSTDINTLPTDLIDRVDIVTGGESAVYGSDAIAGVVNFVLKDHFEGLEAHAQGGISGRGAAGAYYASIVAGKNFAEGRGNIAVNLEYARQNQYLASDVNEFSHADGFVVTDTDPAGAANGSDGIPDRTFMRDIRSATISLGGNILFPQANAGAGICGKDKTGAAFSCGYVFNGDGTLVPQTGTRVGLGPNGSFIGGNGTTGREGALVQLLPQLDRYSANLIGHFEVSPAFVPFIEASYVRTNSFGSGNSGPAFFQGQTLDGFYEDPELNNPYLSAQARSVITQQILASGLNPNFPTTKVALTADDRAAIADGSFRFPLRENLLDLGVRSEAAKRETFRIVGGVRGTFNTDWNYELSANYGEFDERTRVQGNLNVQRFLLAMDAQKSPGGQIVCGSKLDGGAGYTADMGGDIGGNPAMLAADIAGCQPFNPFGYGAVSQAAKNYVLQDTTSVGKITQLDLLGSISGSTRGFLNLPGGPIGFSFGGEYRRETNYFRADPLVSGGYTFYNALADFTPPAFEVKEAFGEVRVPLLKDIFLIKELTATGAFRFSDYKGGAGSVWAYNAGVTYAPIEDVRFRAAYSRSVRAPNLTELYAPQQQNFAPTFSDPCAARQIGEGTQYRAANCAAAGINTGGATPFDYIYSSSLEILSGGNPDLQAEKSDSYTYGVVVQPHWVRGLSISVDYYNIQVNNVITSVDAQTIANQCYDSPSLSNPFCGSFQRDNATGSATGTPFRIIEGSLLASPLNYAQLRARGLNSAITYVHGIGKNMRVNARAIWTHQFENTSFTDPTDPSYGDTTVSEIGSPKDAVNVNVDFTVGKFFINYEGRYLSKQSVTAYESLNGFQGRPAQNADYSDRLYYQAVMYHDIRVGVNVLKNSMFYIGVDNVTDKLPPLGSVGIGNSTDANGGTGIFDNKGRYFYSGFNVKF